MFFLVSGHYLKMLTGQKSQIRLCFFFSAHQSQRLKWNFVSPWPLICGLLWYSLNGSLQNLCLMTLSLIQDGWYSIWLVENFKSVTILLRALDDSQKLLGWLSNPSLISVVFRLLKQVWRHGVIRNHNSKNRRYNGQMKKDENKNNGWQHYIGS